MARGSGAAPRARARACPPARGPNVAPSGSPKMDPVVRAWVGGGGRVGPTAYGPYSHCAKQLSSERARKADLRNVLPESQDLARHVSRGAQACAQLSAADAKSKRSTTRAKCPLGGKGWGASWRRCAPQGVSTQNDVRGAFQRPSTSACGLVAMMSASPPRSWRSAFVRLSRSLYLASSKW